MKRCVVAVAVSVLALGLLVVRPAPAAEQRPETIKLIGDIQFVLIKGVAAAFSDAYLGLTPHGWSHDRVLAEFDGLADQLTRRWPVAEPDNQLKVKYLNKLTTSFVRIKTLSRSLLLDYSSSGKLDGKLVVGLNKATDQVMYRVHQLFRRTVEEIDLTGLPEPDRRKLVEAVLLYSMRANLFRAVKESLSASLVPEAGADPAAFWYALGAYDVDALVYRGLTAAAPDKRVRADRLGELKHRLLLVGEQMQTAAEQPGKPPLARAKELIGLAKELEAVFGRLLAATLN